MVLFIVKTIAQYNQLAWLLIVVANGLVLPYQVALLTPSAQNRQCRHVQNTSLLLGILAMSWLMLNVQLQSMVWLPALMLVVINQWVIPQMTKYMGWVKLWVMAFGLGMIAMLYQVGHQSASLVIYLASHWHVGLALSLVAVCGLHAMLFSIATFYNYQLKHRRPVRTLAFLLPIEQLERRIMALTVSIACGVIVLFFVSVWWYFSVISMHRMYLIKVSLAIICSATLLSIILTRGTLKRVINFPARVMLCASTMCLMCLFSWYGV